MKERVTIESLGARGDGVAMVDGCPVYIQRAVPGDVADVRLHTGESRTEGVIENLIAAGPDRRDPPCPHYADCGGCQLQHVSETAYRAWKESYIRDLCDRAGLRPAEWKPSVFVGPATRRRVTFSATKVDGVVTVGFNGWHSHQIADIKSCLLLTPVLQKILEGIRPLLAPIVHEKGTLDVFLQDVGGHVDCVLTGVSELGARQTENLARFADALSLARVSLREKDSDLPVTQIELATIRKQSGAIETDVPPGAFLQPSEEGEDALVAAVMSGLKGLKGSKLKIMDLFSGCGTFAGRLLERGFVHADEGDRAMVAALQTVAKGNSRLGAEWRDLFKEPVSARELAGYDVVVLDPPRAGAKEQCERLVKSKVPVVIAVACSPQSFVRDARLLVDGGYTLSSIQIVDQFTWSTHTELVGVFRRSV